MPTFPSHGVIPFLTEWSIITCNQQGRVYWSEMKRYIVWQSSSSFNTPFICVSIKKNSESTYRGNKITSNRLLVKHMSLGEKKWNSKEFICQSVSLKVSWKKKSRIKECVNWKRSRKRSRVPLILRMRKWGPVTGRD